MLRIGQSFRPWQPVRSPGCGGWRRLAGALAALVLMCGGTALAQLLPEYDTNAPAPPLPPVPPALPNFNVPQPPPAPVQPPTQRATQPAPYAPRRVPTASPTTKFPIQRPATNRVLQPFPLTFDADVTELAAEPGQTNLVFTFAFRNTSGTEVTLSRVQTSCGCTTTKLPPLPWRLAAGEQGEFSAVLDLRGKRGLLSKMVYVYTSAGFKALTIRGQIPDAAGMAPADRLRNQQLAAADRQAVFKADCARCHSEPGRGKHGRELFQAVCAVCHEAEHRADLVPDLRTLSHPTSADHWRQWVTHGKAGTLMPAFAETEGGPLTETQIDSLVQYLSRRFPAAATAPPPPSAPRP